VKVMNITSNSNSAKPGKQRKAWYNLPLHQRKMLVAAHLSKDLRKSLKRRSLTVRKGDKVKVVRGANAGYIGKVTEVNRVKGVVLIEGLKRRKSDGKEILIPVRPSNLIIEEIEDKDALRLGSTPRGKGKEKGKKG